MSNTEVARFFALVQPKLRAFIRSLVFNPSDVDDIIQDVAAIAIENAHRYDSSRSLDAWVMGIAKKRVLKYFEQRKRQRLRFGNHVVDALADATFSELDQADALETLQHCLDSLDEDKRALVVRRHEPGVTARKLAREIGYTDTRMSRMLNGLYSALMKCMQQRLSPYA